MSNLLLAPPCRCPAAVGDAMADFVVAAPVSLVMVALVWWIGGRRDRSLAGKVLRFRREP